MKREAVVKNRTGKKWILSIGFFAMLITGCAQPSKPDIYLDDMRINRPDLYAEIVSERKLRLSQRTEVMGVSMSCFNHGDYRASGFSVEEVAHGQISRGMIGGAFNCGGVLALGYPVPLTWRPGLKVKVRWNTYAPKSMEATRHEKETTILPYSEAGSLYVHFFPGDQVRVVVSAWYDVGHPLHPIAEDVLTPPPEIE
jgi:hypothetical protein